MKNFSKENTIRILKLPFKLIYLLLCEVFFAFGLLIVSFPVKKTARKLKKKENQVLCLSHVAVSFDGRIKKSANQLLKLGMHVILVKPADAKEDQVLEKTGLDEKIEIKPIGLSGVFSHFPRVFDLCIFLYVTFSKAKFLHCHDINTAFMGILAAKLTGKIVVCDLHEWKSETTDPNQKGRKQDFWQKKIYQLIEKIVLRDADFVITVNEVIGEEIKKFYKINREIYVVKNIPEFTELTSYNMRAVLGIKPDAFVIYYVGQLAPYRNIDKILIAISQCQNVIFVLQGTIEPLYLKQLKDLCESLKISDRAFFLPPVSHDFIPSACQGATVGIFTCHAVAKSMRYSLPNKLFEYLIGEIPIISEDLPVVSSYINGHNIGSLINSNEPQTIIDAINSYLTSDKIKMQKQNVLSLKKEMAKSNEGEAVYRLIYQKGFKR